MKCSIKKSNLGFTLIETMMALVILASALLLLTNSWSGSLMRLNKTQLVFEVAALLERKMTEVEIKYKGKPLDSIPETAEDSFGDEYPQYSWKLASKKLEIPDLSSALRAQNGGEDQMLVGLVKQLTEGLSKSVKEVTVTVIFKPAKGKGAEYSVTTYFVDYDQEISFGVPGG